MALRDQLEKTPLPIERVDTPEWADPTDPDSGHTFVRTLSVNDRLSLEEAMGRHKDKPFAGLLLSFCLCKEDGTPEFTEGDIDLLNRQSSRPMLRCFKVAERLNKISSDDVSQLEKNS